LALGRPVVKDGTAERVIGLRGARGGIARCLQEAREWVSRGDWQENAGKTLYRGMQETPEGEPAVGLLARTLGARPHVDIPVDPSGSVYPGTGGMSVAHLIPRATCHGTVDRLSMEGQVKIPYGAFKKGILVYI
jgi:hypothetical protein